MRTHVTSTGKRRMVPVLDWGTHSSDGVVHPAWGRDVALIQNFQASNYRSMTEFVDGGGSPQSWYTTRGRLALPAPAAWKALSPVTGDLEYWGYVNGPLDWRDPTTGTPTSNQLDATMYARSSHDTTKFLRDDATYLMDIEGDAYVEHMADQVAQTVNVEDWDVIMVDNMGWHLGRGPFYECEASGAATTWGKVEGVTVSAATDIFTKTAHGLVDGQPVWFHDTGNTTPALAQYGAPTGLAANLMYYVDYIDANTFKLVNDAGTVRNVTADGTFTLLKGAFAVSRKRIASAYVTPTSGTDDPDWPRARTKAESLDAGVAYVARLKSALLARGVGFDRWVVNCVNESERYYDAVEPVSRFHDVSDCLCVEGFLRSSTAAATTFPTYDSTAALTDHDLNRWSADLQMVLDAEHVYGRSLGVITKMWIEYPTAAQRDKWHRFSLASFLLVANGRHLWLFTDDGIADHQSNVYTTGMSDANRDDVRLDRNAWSLGTQGLQSFSQDNRKEANLTITRTHANFNATTNRFGYTTHGLDNGQPCYWSSTTPPSGFSQFEVCFAKRIDADTFELYADADLTTIIDWTDWGSGTKVLQAVDGWHAIRWDTVWDDITPLGEPTESFRFISEARLSNGLHRRDFEGGCVLVNPTNSTVTSYALGGSYTPASSILVPSGVTGTITTITLAADESAILLDA